jgi:hypothetical protein
LRFRFESFLVNAIVFGPILLLLFAPQLLPDTNRSRSARANTELTPAIRPCPPEMSAQSADALFLPSGAPRGRAGHSLVWTDTEMLVWGGSAQADGDGSRLLGDGARYDPNADRWTPITMEGAPAPRSGHRAVWTGTEMIIWGGGGRCGVPFDSGGRYDPPTDTWKPLPPSGLPEGFDVSAAVWTGSEMIVWGGKGANSARRNAGARYDPILDIWKPITDRGAPRPRGGETVVWTGSVMIVWGGATVGSSTYPDGGRYNPLTDSWIPIRPIPDWVGPIAKSVWTGTELIVWDGSRGVRYDPLTETWSSISSETGVAPRVEFEMVWTGREVIFWGGWQKGNRSHSPIFDDGAAYDPATDAWRSISERTIPNSRSAHKMVWTGTELLIWGGYGHDSRNPPQFERYPAEVERYTP